jgi:hypothetical protein
MLAITRKSQRVERKVRTRSKRNGSR